MDDAPSKWKPGDRVLIQIYAGGSAGYETYTYEMATLLRKTTGYDHWWFAYDNRPHGEPGDCCSEKWIHEPGVLDKLADL